jgi:hypothetical protein
MPATVCQISPLVRTWGMCTRASRFSDLAARVHIRSPSLSSLLLLLYNYMGGRTLKWVYASEAATSWVSCHDRQAIFGTRRQVLPGNDLPGGGSASLHHYALGWFVPLVSSRERSLPRTLSTRTRSGSTQEQAGGIGCDQQSSFNNNGALVDHHTIKGDRSCVAFRRTAMTDLLGSAERGRTRARGFKKWKPEPVSLALLAHGSPNWTGVRGTSSLVVPSSSRLATDE